jgi:hypothetical protein
MFLVLLILLMAVARGMFWLCLVTLTVGVMLLALVAWLTSTATRTEPRMARSIWGAAEGLMRACDSHRRFVLPNTR